MIRVMPPEVPVAAERLGLAGLLPFIAGTLAVVAGGPWRDWGLSALLGYGAVILSFMGGVHWGMAIVAADVSPARLAWSVVWALIGWAGLLWGGDLGLLLVAAGFAALFAYDRRAAGRNEAPAWYPALRRPLTAVVVACLVLAILAGR
jgi:hypothetical protein